ncbi:MAG: putative membrane protein YhhN, partial [Limisphaerales bacterium]
EIWFLLGLGSFLVGHICYVFAFTTGPFVSDNKKQSWVKKNPWAILLFVVYAAGLLYTLRNGIEGFLWLAVPIYAFAIAMMALSAMNRKLKVPSVSYSLTLSGALIFVASDSTIALDRFGSEYLGDFQGAGAIIMLTYTVAQLLIVAGILSQRSENAVKE